MATITEQYQKALKVIRSCVTPVQLKGARKYMNLFFAANSRPVKYSKDKRVPTHPSLNEYYEKLKFHLWAKDKSFKKLKKYLD